MPCATLMKLLRWQSSRCCYRNVYHTTILIHQNIRRVEVKKCCWKKRWFLFRCAEMFITIIIARDLGIQWYGVCACHCLAEFSACTSFCVPLAVAVMISMTFHVSAVQCTILFTSTMRIEIIGYPKSIWKISCGQSTMYEDIFMRWFFFSSVERQELRRLSILWNHPMEKRTTNNCILKTKWWHHFIRFHRNT